MENMSMSTGGGSRTSRDPLELWETQSELLHKQLGHILLIRGWAASLAAGLVVAMISSQQPLILLGGAVLVAFWYTEHVYGKYLEAYARRESALRQILAKEFPEGDIRDAMATEVGYRSGLPRFVSYSTMLGVLAATAFYFKCLT